MRMQMQMNDCYAMKRKIKVKVVQQNRR